MITLCRVAKVLVVDDHADQCAALTRLLQHYGHDATCMTDAEQALAWLLKERVDLLILDIMMPGLDGMEIMGMLRRSARIEHLPIIVFSAIEDAAFQRYVMSKGANDYWVKASLDFARLEARINHVLTAAKQYRGGNGE